MNYPLISEYVEAIKASEDNFDQLNHIRPVLGENGEPVMTSGNFAVVFKMKDEQSGKLYAVKCFTKEQEGRAEAYREIAKELKDVSSPYLVSIRYFEKELFVDTDQTTETEFPVLLMDWVEGKTLDKYMRENLDDKYALEMLAYRFSQLAQWLIPQPFAHGDLKPDNILVREDGTLVLVDYDGMYVPAMKGQRARELGSPDFRHPLRTEDDFDEQIDVFPFISILLSLKAVSLCPQLWKTDCRNYSCLFLNNEDAIDVYNNSLIRSFFPSKDKELNCLISLYAIAVSEKHFNFAPLLLLGIKKPKISKLVFFPQQKLNESLTDEKGALYSKDGQWLLKVPPIEHYIIKFGTRIVGDWAFDSNEYLQRVCIPNTIVHIGTRSFSGCHKLETVSIPNSVESIGTGAFLWCSQLNNIDIPDSVLTIGTQAFSGCDNLEKIVIPSSVLHIGSEAFSWCHNLLNVSINESVISIGNNPFVGCDNLKNITCKSKMFFLQDGILYSHGAEKIISCALNDSIVYDIPNSVVEIGNSSFRGNKSLKRVTIPESVKHIGAYAFSGCKNLNQIVIPHSVTTIGNGAFEWCEKLEQIVIPNSVVSIGRRVFWWCNNLRIVYLPYSLQEIGYDSFDGCNLKIVIPWGTRRKFEQMLPSDWHDNLIES